MSVTELTYDAMAVDSELGMQSGIRSINRHNKGLMNPRHAGNGGQGERWWVL